MLYDSDSARFHTVTLEDIRREDEEALTDAAMLWRRWDGAQLSSFHAGRHTDFGGIRDEYSFQVRVSTDATPGMVHDLAVKLEGVAAGRRADVQFNVQFMRVPVYPISEAAHKKPRGKPLEYIWVEGRYLRPRSRRDRAAKVN
jgi:hypothetical protein